MSSDREKYIKDACASYPGWAPLIRCIDETIKNTDPNYEVQQIKEKFGGLRFYFGCQSIFDINKIVNNIAGQSSKLCDNCGTSKEVTSKANEGSYWIRTLCEKCRNR